MHSECCGFATSVLLGFILSDFAEQFRQAPHNECAQSLPPHVFVPPLALCPYVSFQCFNLLREPFFSGHLWSPTLFVTYVRHSLSPYAVTYRLRYSIKARSMMS